MIERLVRYTALSSVVIAAVAAAWTRGFRAPLGVLGGGLLIGLSYWAIRGTVDALIARAETPLQPTRFQLVKFFTRHAMLALAAYVMMVRLHLDPVGLLAGVSSLAVALAVEVLRDLRWRRFP